MIFEFDKDFAKEAVATRLGRIITKEKREVVIENWECKVHDMPECSIRGYLIDTGNHFYWTDEGKLIIIFGDISQIVKLVYTGQRMVNWP